MSNSKIPNAVNVVLTVCKSLETVDAVMDETAYVRLVIAAQAIRVNNAARPHLPVKSVITDGFRVEYGNSINLLLRFKSRIHQLSDKE